MTQHNGHHGKSSPLVTAARDVTQVAYDVMELAELQAAMARLELQGWWKQFIMPVVLLILAGALASCFLLMALASASLFLSSAAEISLALSVLLVAAGAALIGVVLAMTALSRIKHARGPLEASKQEFSRNLRWIKNSLKASARTATGRQPSRSEA